MNSPLLTLLEAAKYVEYRSEAKKRGEEPYDYNTYSKLSASDNESRDDSHTQAEQMQQRRQQQLSNSSHSSEEIKEKRRSIGPVTKDSVLSHEHSGTGAREVHNKLEKNRRAHLKECFEALKKQLPNMDERKTSNLSILRGAIRFIQLLKRKEREYEHDMERLAREKIAFQQRLSALRKDLASQLDQIDANTIPDDENETTTTASECEGNASDFEDSLPPEPSIANSSSEFTSSSSSSTASSVLVGPVAPTVSSTSLALPKQTSTGAQSSASLKESHSNMNQFSHESLLTVANKTPMATPVQSAVSHPVNNSENTAQTARVFSTGNIHAIGGIFASPHTMQVITQPSGIKVITTPNSIMASNSSVQHLSVNHHQHGQIHVLAPSSSTSYASSITATSKPFSSDSLVQVASSTTKSISKPHLVSPLALVSPQTMVGVSHSSAGKSLNNNTAIADMVSPSGSSGSLNLSQSAIKGNSVLSGNMTIAVKNNLSSNSVTTCASHSNMIATLHVSKAHSQVIQPSLASSIITQGGSQVNNGTHHGVTSGLKPIVSTPVRSLPHIASVAHVAHVVSQPPMSAPVGQIVAQGNHVSAVTPLVGSVSVVSHPGAVHQQSIGKVLASPVLKSVNQISPIPIIQQQFLQQVSVGSSNQPIVKPVVVVSMPNMGSSNNLSNLTATSLVTINEQPGAVRGSGPQK